MKVFDESSYETTESIILWEHLEFFRLDQSVEMHDAILSMKLPHMLQKNK